MLYEDAGIHDVGDFGFIKNFGGFTVLHSELSPEESASPGDGLFRDFWKVFTSSEYVDYIDFNIFRNGRERGVCLFAEYLVYTRINGDYTISSLILKISGNTVRGAGGIVAQSDNCNGSGCFEKLFQILFLFQR